MACRISLEGMQMIQGWQARRTDRLAFALALWLCLGLECVGVAQQEGNQRNPDAVESEGRAVFSQCSACHALTPGHNGRGPTLYHLFGRRSGTVPGYDYSDAMKRSAIVWRDDTLERFIIDPQEVIPGSTMTYAISSADRTKTKELIDFLHTATR